MRPFVYIVLLAFLLVGVSFAQDLGGVVTVLTEATTQTKSIAAAIVILLSSLLAIGLVVMLYLKVANK
jgi:spore maturation protein SpmA